MSTGVQPDSHAPGLAARGYVNRILAPLTPAPTLARACARRARAAAAGTRAKQPEFRCRRPGVPWTPDARAVQDGARSADRCASATRVGLRLESALLERMVRLAESRFLNGQLRQTFDFPSALSVGYG